MFFEIRLYGRRFWANLRGRKVKEQNDTVRRAINAFTEPYQDKLDTAIRNDYLFLLGRIRCSLPSQPLQCT